MKTAGYATYMSGKWHVTPHVKPEGPKYNWPRQRGFDRFYGTIHGAGSFFDPNSLTRENTQVSPLTDKGYQTDDYYYTDAISDHAVRYIEEHKGDQPFFLYVAYTAPHRPMHATENEIAAYKGFYDKGWDAVRKARYARQLKMGLIDPKWKNSPRDGKATSWGDAKNKAWELRLMETYAAMVTNMDAGMGRVVDALKTTGQYDNTLILFLADNGGCAEGMGRRNGIQYRDQDPEQLKPMGKGDLQFDMIPRRTRDGRVVKQGTEVMTGGDDTYHGYGWLGPVTRPSANTNTGCTKAASVPLSSPIGPRELTQSVMENLKASPAISLILWPPVSISAAPNIRPRWARPRSCPYRVPRLRRLLTARTLVVKSRSIGSMKATAPCARASGSSLPRALVALGQCTSLMPIALS